jgi:hypothetical protein
MIAKPSRAAFVRLYAPRPRAKQSDDVFCIRQLHHASFASKSSSSIEYFEG